MAKTYYNYLNGMESRGNSGNNIAGIIPGMKGGDIRHVTQAGSSLTPAGWNERNQLFDYLHDSDATTHGATNDAVSAARGAAYDPAWAQIHDYGQRVLGGEYLDGSPTLDHAMSQMRSAASNEGANQAGRVREQFAQNGLGFGTANQQAQQSAQAAATGHANQVEAGARLQNYQTERGYQQAAPGYIEMADNAPVKYLSAIPGMINDPATQRAQMISSLYSRGQNPVVDSELSHAGQFSRDLGSAC